MKKVHVVLVRHIDIFRVLVETDSSSEQYERQDAEKAAKKQVEMFWTDRSTAGAVEMVGTKYEFDILAVGPSVPQVERVL